MCWLCVSVRVRINTCNPTIVALAALVLAGPAAAQVKNGFDVVDALIPFREIRAGGPPRDGIPALTDPNREAVGEADRWLEGDDRVIGLVVGGEAVAYPIRILNWHEVVNDVVGGRPLVVTYCTLCGTGVVFDATLGEGRMLFGVSGLLYKSDMLFFDRRTESLFSQLMLKAISGPLRGTELNAVPSLTTTWDAWKARHADTSVVSLVTGHFRDYGTDPYRWYRKSSQTMFPVRDADRSRGPKEWAWLVLADDESIIVAEEVLAELAGEEVGTFRTDEGVVLRYDPSARERSTPAGPEGRRIVIPGYWFALTAFHPESHHIRVSDLESLPREPVLSNN